MLLQRRSWRSTVALTYSAIGVVYGDVGTSPLYVFSSTFTEGTPTETDVLGAMSIIFWTITLIVVVKYMLIVLLADDNGEGRLCCSSHVSRQQLQMIKKESNSLIVTITFILADQICCCNLW